MLDLLSPTILDVDRPDSVRDLEFVSRLKEVFSVCNLPKEFHLHVSLLPLVDLLLGRSEPNSPRAERIHLKRERA